MSVSLGGQCTSFNRPDFSVSTRPNGGGARQTGGIHGQNDQRRSCLENERSAFRSLSGGKQRPDRHQIRPRIGAIASRDDPRRNRETRSIPIGTVKGRYLRPFFSSLASLIRITTRPLSGSAFRLSVKPFPSRVAHSTPMSVHRALSPSPFKVKRRWLGRFRLVSDMMFSFMFAEGSFPRFMGRGRSGRTSQIGRASERDSVCQHV